MKVVLLIIQKNINIELLEIFIKYIKCPKVLKCVCIFINMSKGLVNILHISYIYTNAYINVI